MHSLTTRMEKYQLGWRLTETLLHHGMWPFARSACRVQSQHASNRFAPITAAEKKIQKTKTDNIQSPRLFRNCASINIRPKVSITNSRRFSSSPSRQSCAYYIDFRRSFCALVQPSPVAVYCRTLPGKNSCRFLSVLISLKIDSC